jgi:hypothetical protein
MEKEKKYRGLVKFFLKIWSYEFRGPGRLWASRGPEL